MMHLFDSTDSVHRPRGPACAGPRAEDGARTRDLNLGKVALYQLSYFRRRVEL